MKTLRLSISLALLICNFISITGTAQNRTAIQLDSIPSNRVIKDLEKGDLCNQKLNVSNENIKVKDRTINSLESKVNLLEVGIEKLNFAILKKDEGLDFQKEIITNNQKLVNLVKRKVVFLKVLIAILSAALGYEIIK